jgi:hypothetical protein
VSEVSISQEYYYEISDGHTTMKSYVRANSEEEARNVAIDVNNWNEYSVEDFAAVLKDEHDLLDE